MFGGASAEETLDGRAAGLATIRRYRLLRKRKIVKNNVSLPLRVSLWRWNS